MRKTKKTILGKPNQNNGNFEGSGFTGEQSGLNDVMYVVNILSV